MSVAARILWIAVLLCLLSPAASANTVESPAGLAGKSASLFSTTDLAGATIVMKNLLKSNSLVVMNFWGVRCGSCLEEMPFLFELHKKYSSRKVFFLGMNVDGLAGQKIQQQLAKTGMNVPYTLAVDPEFKVMDLYGVTVAPLTLLILPSGSVIYRHEGFSPGDEKELEAKILEVLTKPPEVK